VEANWRDKNLIYLATTTSENNCVIRQPEKEQQQVAIPVNFGKETQTLGTEGVSSLSWEKKHTGILTQ